MLLRLGCSTTSTASAAGFRRTSNLFASSCIDCTLGRNVHRLFATVHSPPPTLANPSPSPVPAAALDAAVQRQFNALFKAPSPATAPKPLHSIVDSYTSHSGVVLKVTLPYESTPSATRRCTFDRNDDVSLVAHYVGGDFASGEHEMGVSTGFFLDGGHGPEGDEDVLVTCAHTLEQTRRTKLYSTAAAIQPSGVVHSGTLISTQTSTRQSHHRTASRVLSSLPRSDLVLLSVPRSKRDGHNTSVETRTLPISPYPVHPGTPIRAHFTVDREPPAGEGWEPWVEGTWHKWVKGTVIGYRDAAGREAKPGTYDSLAHMFFEPLPTPGSSGGPIVDEEHGAVVGVILGTQMVNRIDGVRGWGAPAELVFEMFRLPGLTL